MCSDAKRGISPLEFEEEYLPNGWGESDLQRLVLSQLQRRWLGFSAATEEVIPMARVMHYAGGEGIELHGRSDIETLTHRYELKKYLTREAIQQAAGQLDLYHRWGKKRFGVLGKKRVIMGLAPEAREYESAWRIAQNFREAGVEVIFINECPEWFPSTFGSAQGKPLSLGQTLIVGVSLAIGVAGLSFGVVSSLIDRAPNPAPLVESGNPVESGFWGK